MKKWLFWTRWEFELCFWEIFTSAGHLICRSLGGFSTEAEALADLREYHPEDHF